MAKRKSLPSTLTRCTVFDGGSYCLVTRNLTNQNNVVSRKGRGLGSVSKRQCRKGVCCRAFLKEERTIPVKGGECLATTNAVISNEVFS